MTVGELISELSECEPDAEVVIAVSVNTVVALLGVMDEGEAVILDPALAERSLPGDTA